MSLPATATESHQRIRLQHVTGAPVVHGTIIPGTYDVTANTFEVVLDTQKAGDPPLLLSPTPAMGVFMDQNSVTWTLITWTLTN